MKRTGRCLCGLKIALHFDMKNRKLSCDEAREQHPRAHVGRNDLKKMLYASGATK